MVVGTDRRYLRHAESRRSILTAAWELAERDGLNGFSFGELARAMGMRPQSLYTYFESKHALYDAMYRQGFEELASHWHALRPGRDVETFLGYIAEDFIDFAAERPSRYQLLFQRTVPGFKPSQKSFAVALDVLALMRSWLHHAGMTNERELDLWRALLLGLAGEQLANDLGGRRWRDLSKESVRYFVRFCKQRQRRET